jgi:hypothetical protein
VETRGVSARPGEWFDLPDAEIARIVAGAVTGEGAARKQSPGALPIYVGLRSAGRLIGSVWRSDASLPDVVRDALASHGGGGGRSVDTLEMCLTYDYAIVPPGALSREVSNSHRGIRGIEIAYLGQVERVAPSATIATNRTLQRVFDRFLERHGIGESSFFEAGGVVRRFEARQVLVSLTPAPTATTLHRGNRIIELQTMSGDTVGDMIRTMSDWLARHVAPSGRMVYKYWPSRGEESRADNTIRQFMTTLCLVRLARSTGRADLLELAGRNCDHNLERFFRLQGAVGVIEHDGKAKLGATALAALALLEHPSTERYEPALALLRRGVESLWQEDGSFRTFHKPADRNDNQNFYPGEALLFWANLYQRERDPRLLEQCRKTFEHYREWHRRRRNPAFVPWHTQACAVLYEHTREAQFRDFVFEMNDWLLPLQQWDLAPHADLRGRFYDPSHPEYGPPHASSTGVYLEGLADAFRLASDAGDDTRAARYQQSIWRGLRSIRQLQFLDEVDMFYVSKRDRVRGAVRTETYDNTVRVDNVQHALMALLKLVRQPAFAEHADATPIGSDTWHGATTLPGPVPAGSRPIAADPGPRRGEGYAHFTLVDARVDIEPFLGELRENASLWLQDTSRQDKTKVQRETNTIYLRGPVKPFPPGVSGNDVHESRATRVSGHFPQTMRWLERFAEAVDGELGRAIIVRLSPRGRVYRHIDKGEYYRLRDRYHLVLHSPEGSPLTCGDETAKMRERELWCFDNKTPHEARNDSDEWRVHLIFDILPAAEAAGALPTRAAS